MFIELGWVANVKLDGFLVAFWCGISSISTQELGFMHPRTLCSAHNLCNILREQAWFMLFKWGSVFSFNRLLHYDICFFLMKPKEMLYINNIESNNNTHIHIYIYINIYLYRHIHIYSIIWYNACNVHVTCGKRETEAKFQSHLFRAFFGNVFLTPPFHLSWFTTAARVTLNKPPSCCQRQWHHYKRWGLCQIEDSVILCHLCFASNFDWKSHLKFFDESQDDCYGLMYGMKGDIMWHPFLQVCGKDHPRTLVAVAGPNIPQRGVGHMGHLGIGGVSLLLWNDPKNDSKKIVYCNSIHPVSNPNAWELLYHFCAHLKVFGFISSLMKLISSANSVISNVSLLRS